MGVLKAGLLPDELSERDGINFLVWVEGGVGISGKWLCWSIKNPIALYFSATPKTRRLKKKQLLSLQYPGKLPMRGQNKDIFQHARSQKNWPHLHPFLGSPRHVYNQNKGANQDVGSWKQMTPERRPQNNGKSKSQDDSGAANQKRSRRDFKTESTEYLRCLNILRGNFYDWGRV